MKYVGFFCLTNELVYMLKSFYGWPKKPATAGHASLNRHLQNRPNQQSRYKLTICSLQSNTCAVTNVAYIRKNPLWPYDCGTQNQVKERIRNLKRRSSCEYLFGSKSLVLDILCLSAAEPFLRN